MSAGFQRDDPKTDSNLKGQQTSFLRVKLAQRNTQQVKFPSFISSI